MRQTHSDQKKTTPFIHLSHILDPKDGAFPDEPALEVYQNSVVSETGKPFNSTISMLPDHVGTHMNGPHHFSTTGLDLHELPIGFFAYEGDEVLVTDLSHRGKPREIILKEDIKSYAEQSEGRRLLLLRAGFFRTKFADPHTYEYERVSIYPEFSKYLDEKFPELARIGANFLSLGSSANDYGPEAYRWFPGNYAGYIACTVEDINLGPLGDERIKATTLGPLRVKGAGSLQASVMA